MCFNDCIVGKSGQSTKPIIVNIDPVPYNSIYMRTLMFSNLLIANVGKTRNSQLIDTVEPRLTDTPQRQTPTI